MVKVWLEAGKVRRRVGFGVAVALAQGCWDSLKCSCSPALSNRLSVHNMAMFSAGPYHPETRRNRRGRGPSRRGMGSTVFDPCTPANGNSECL